jgi:hypothetical protein
MKAQGWSAGEMIGRYTQSIAIGRKRKALEIRLFDLDQLSSLPTA